MIDHARLREGESAETTLKASAANGNQPNDLRSVASAIHDVTGALLAADRQKANDQIDSAYLTVLGLAARHELDLADKAHEGWYASRRIGDEELVSQVVGDLSRAGSVDNMFRAVFHIGWALAGIRQLGLNMGHDVPVSVSRTLDRQAA